MVFSMCMALVSLFFQISSSYKDISKTGLGHILECVLEWSLFKGSISTVTFQGSQG